MSYSCFTPKGSPLTVPHVHLYRHSVHGKNHRLSTGVTPEIVPEPWGPQMKHPRRLAQKSCSARCPPCSFEPRFPSSLRSPIPHCESHASKVGLCFLSTEQPGNSIYENCGISFNGKTQIFKILFCFPTFKHKNFFFIS